MTFPLSWPFPGDDERVLATDRVSLPPNRIIGSGKSRDKVKARSLICHRGMLELGLTMTHLAATLGISVPTASVSAKRGEGFSLRLCAFA